MRKILICSVFIVLLLSCQKRDTDFIIWTESNIICVHWTDFAKEKFNTKAIRIVLKNEKLNDLSSKEFRLKSHMNGQDFELRLIKGTKRDGSNFSLSIPSKDFYEMFPKGSNTYNDDCYQIELANIVGQAKLEMTERGEKYEIKKSANYKFTIGPQ